MKESDSGFPAPAFACAAENGHQPGMDMRDYFASAAMQAFTRNACQLNIAHVEVNWDDHASIADVAYALADAMLEARKK